MFTLIKKLYRTRLLTLVGLIHLCTALIKTGTNLMAMLHLAARLYPHRTAVVDEREQLSYTELWQHAESLAIALHLDYGIQRGQKVAIVCRNHASAIKTIFAVSRLGAHIFLLNGEMSQDQILALEERLQFDFYVYDEQVSHLFTDGLLTHKALGHKALPAYHPTAPSIDQISSSPRTRKIRLRTFKTGNIVVMTGGTTGQPKSASRKTSILNFLPPFFALLTQVHLDQYQSVYVATPIYHGFGVASLFMGVILGATLYFTTRFDAERSCALIARNQIEVVTLVPLMLQRLLQFDAASLSSLRCIISGGALLNPTLVQQTFEQLEARLFNLYGTSEAGFCIMATPEILARKPGSIGQPIPGVRVKVVTTIANAKALHGSRPATNTPIIGHLCIHSAWTISQKSWIETGDLAYQDPDGDLILCGRVDDMIVSGGENVYPIELENILVQHPDINSAGVIGIPDPEFGQRLKAFVSKKLDTTLDETTLLAWLKPRVARYQMPALIEFCDQLPYTSLGKLDKKILRGTGLRAKD